LNTRQDDAALDFVRVSVKFIIRSVFEMRSKKGEIEAAQIIPKPLAFSIALNSFVFSLSRLE
jgi:hypothetical protein